MPEPSAVELRCPRCRRFLSEAAEYGRAVCSDCGWEVAVQSAASRRAHGSLARPSPA